MKLLVGLIGVSKKYMLEANKKRWFEKLFSVYNRNLLNRRFNSFNVCGLENLIDRQNEIPTIVYCNHSSWWDGLVAYHIFQKIKLDSYVMMEEKQLKNLQLFRKLGAFSIVRENPREAIKSINYSVRLLKDQSSRAIWIFPQGEILPNDVRPIQFYNGISRIIQQLEKSQLFAVAMRYEFLNDYKPDIFVKIGKAEVFCNVNKSDRKKITSELAKNMSNQLKNLKKSIKTNQLESFENII